MGALAVIVETGDLLLTVLVSFAAGLGVALVSSLGIWGAARYVDLSQEGKTASAWFALAVGAFGLLATVGLIAFGIYLMIAG